MKFLSVFLAVQWIIIGTCEGLLGEAEDCVQYESDAQTTSQPTKTLHRQLSTGIAFEGDPLVVILSLTSSSGGSCSVMLYNSVMTIQCGKQSQKYSWSPETKGYNFIELWIHLGSLSDDEDALSSDLAVVGRYGSNRGHFLFPSSGLLPPVQLSLKSGSMDKIKYYYNCVTGCLLTQKLVTSPGIHSFFFRPEENFAYLHISYRSPRYNTIHNLTLNSSDIAVNDGWKNVTVVWDAGEIGALADGIPLRELDGFKNLGDKSQIEAQVVGGGGHLTLCDSEFKKMANAKTVAKSLSGDGQVPEAISQKPEGDDMSKNWLVVLALVCIFLLLVISIILVVFLLKTKRDLQTERDASTRDDIAMEASRSTGKNDAPSSYRAPKTHQAQVVSATAKGRWPAPAAPISNTSRISYNGSRT